MAYGTWTWETIRQRSARSIGPPNFFARSPLLISGGTYFLNQGQLGLEREDYSAAREHFRLSLETGPIAAYEPVRWVAFAGLGLADLHTGNISRAKEFHRKLPPHPSSVDLRSLLVAGA